MILYRKAPQLRVRHLAAPEPPFWCASAVAPYSARRSTPLAIDYLTLRATGSTRLEVTVCEQVRDELERNRRLIAPVLIEASGAAEQVFRRGEEAAVFCGDEQLTSVVLVSTDGSVPLEPQPGSVLAIAAWPPEMLPLEQLFAAARAGGFEWGVLLPVSFPVTTDLSTIERIAARAAEAGASFLTAVTIEGDATARMAMARTLALDPSDDRYAMLFHANLEPVHLSTERHIAALAAESGLADFLLLPGWPACSNWNASVLLTLTASRMIAMELDLDLAGQIARSARIVAELDKPLTRIAEAASLSIVSGLDETSTGILNEWLAGENASFVEFVNDQWRLRRA